MVRGTFANVRLKNLLAPGTEGGVTRHLPDGEVMSIFDASEKYLADGDPAGGAGRQGIRQRLVARLGGQGAAGCWACALVIAESYERIHRSNLVGMGILPLQFLPGENAESLGLTGEEVFETVGLPEALARDFAAGSRIKVRARRADDTTVGVHHRSAHRYPAGGAVLPARRDPAVRAAAADAVAAWLIMGGPVAPAAPAGVAPLATLGCHDAGGGGECS